ncbi:MAG TPA: glycosyltransferase [Smithella sp.]|nr:glycosyltransferase [Smithella sp.]HOG91418.1 glycosyltransferase [Smithella sp.]
MNPLISFYVIACNQEQFISEAVSGALAQTWSPLEVVLSDDCSNDSTFEIIKNMARDYRGPHKIILNRNEKRLGVGAHINRILQICTGEWIVASAGDDVSEPARTEKLYSHWLSLGKKPGLVYSNIIEVKEDGSLLCERDFRKEAPGEWTKDPLSWDYRQRLHFKIPLAHGAAFGYPRRTFDDFGPLWNGIVFEDNVLNWRAELTGGISLCPDYLVRHRNHSGQLTNLYSKEAIKNADERRRILWWSDIQSLKQNISDLNIAFKKGCLTKEEYQELEKNRADALSKVELEYRLYWSPILKRWKVLLFNLQTLNKQIKLTKFLFAILPRPLYSAALRLKGFLNDV